MCMVDGGEPATLYRDKVVARARKVHECAECGRTIELGEQYHTATMLYDGWWSTFASCVHCMAAEAWLKDQCGGFLHGGVLQDLQEHVDELPFTEPGSKVRLLRLIVGVQHGWRRITNPAQLMAVRA